MFVSLLFNCFQQVVSVNTSTTLPPLPAHRDVLTQTDFRPPASVSASPPQPRQYRLSPKSRRAPSPPGPQSQAPPPIPPPPPSRSPLQMREYLDNPSSFSYYTSPISTLNLNSSLTFSTLSSDQGISRYYPNTDNRIRNSKIRKAKAPSPPIMKTNDNVNIS